MKVCVHYPYLHNADAFESARLRKTLKGACELVGISWDEEPDSSTEIAHFLSPLDEKLLLRCKKKGIKTVLSCFYCENDYRASFLTREGDDIKISDSALRVMNEADLILVPTSSLAELSIKQGVKTPLEVLPSGVNLERFSRKSIEANIFPRYFRVSEENKFVMCVGAYRDKKTIISLQKLARLTPNIRFYFFGAKHYLPLRVFKGELMRRSPSNLIFEPIVEDDVYRSALMHCMAYLLLDDEHPDQMALMDAFASGTEVVALGEQKANPVLKDKVNCLLFPNEEEASLALSRLYLAPDKAIIMAGRKEAERCALPLFASELKKNYEKVLQK